MALQDCYLGAVSNIPHPRGLVEGRCYKTVTTPIELCIGDTGLVLEVPDMAVRENVKRTVTRLRSASEPILIDPLKGGKLKIVGARYDLDDGGVDFFMEN